MKRKINIDRPGVDPREISRRREAGFDKVINVNSSPAFGGSRGWYLTGGIAALVATGLIVFFLTRDHTPRPVQSSITKPEIRMPAPSGTAVAMPFINPPIAKLDMPYEVFKVNTVKGGTFTYKRHGSTFSIPANSFVYSNGTDIRGDVTIKYREMHDAAEVFVSGIPMAYDSAGQRYHFETAGMVEITAWKDGQQVQLKKGRKVEIRMRSFTDGSRFNLYNLDTVARNWTYLGKDKIERESATSRTYAFYSSLDTSIGGPMNQIFAETETIKQELVTLRQAEPQAPKKANPKRYRFNIEVSRGEFPDLATFKGVQFEVDSSEKSFNSGVFYTQWQDANLEEIKKGVSYRIHLKARKSNQSYLVYPVYEGKDYEQAMEQFNESYASYSQKVKEREEEMKRKQEEYEAYLKNYAELQKKQFEQQFKTMDGASKIYRTFSVSGFGIYNCDCPHMWPKGAPIAAIFEDEEGQPVNMNSPYLVEKGRNAMFYLYGEPGFSKTKFSYTRGARNMIFGATKHGKVAIFTSEDFEKIPADAKKYTFTMRILNQEFADVDELKKYLGI